MLSCRFLTSSIHTTSDQIDELQSTRQIPSPAPLQDALTGPTTTPDIKQLGLFGLASILTDLLSRPPLRFLAYTQP